VFSNLFSITLPNIEKYFPGIHFPEIHFSRNSLSKKKLLSSKQTGPKKKVEHALLYNHKNATTTKTMGEFELSIEKSNALQLDDAIHAHYITKSYFILFFPRIDQSASSSTQFF
jgi:hypothetical protein